jgi:DNA-directed RNA polymerase subunit M/transcription elongation factor TFIIS
MPNRRRRPARVYRVHDPHHRELLATFEHQLDASRYAMVEAGNVWDVVVIAGRRETLHESRRAGGCPECGHRWRLYELRKREDEGLSMYGCGVCGARFESGHDFNGTAFALAGPATYPIVRSDPGATNSTRNCAIAQAPKACLGP